MEERNLEKELLYEIKQIMKKADKGTQKLISYGYRAWLIQAKEKTRIEKLGFFKDYAKAYL